MRQDLKAAVRPLTVVIVTVIVGIGICPLPRASADGTPVGRYAARLVDPVSYQMFMEEELYAHDGDDRGFGPEHDLCRDNIEQLFTDFGLQVSMHPFTWSGSTYYNVVGEIPGTTRADEIYVVAGHFDSVDNPGADDNASAVAALLEIARIAGRWRPEATIRLISFDREEQWLIGSQAYVDDFWYEDFRGVVSLDMIAYSGSDPDKARIHGRSLSDPLKNALARAVGDYGGLTPIVLAELDRTDHAPFEWAGFQGCWFAEYNYIERNPHYHRMTDSVDTPNYIDYEYGAKMTRAVIGWLVDEAGLAPTLFSNTTVLSKGGGTVEFKLWAGAEWAGREYFLLASGSGVDPGMRLPGGGTLPLNRDAATEFIYTHNNNPAFVGFRGNFDAAGSATAILGPDSVPFPVGKVLHFAYTTVAPYDLQSNPLGVEVVPGSPGVDPADDGQEAYRGE